MPLAEGTSRKASIHFSVSISPMLLLLPTGCKDHIHCTGAFWVIPNALPPMWSYFILVCSPVSDSIPTCVCVCVCVCVWMGGFLFGLHLCNSTWQRLAGVDNRILLKGCHITKVMHVLQLYIQYTVCKSHSEVHTTTKGSVHGGFWHLLPLMILHTGRAQGFVKWPLNYNATEKRSIGRVSQSMSLHMSQPGSFIKSGLHTFQFECLGQISRHSPSIARVAAFHWLASILIVESLAAGQR